MIPGQTAVNSYREYHNKCSHKSAQVGLGVTLGKKSLVQQFHDLGTCCSYDEVLRFKASASVAASSEMQLTGIQSSDIGLVQAIADNFLTQWIKVNPCFSLLMTQVCPNTEDSQEENKIKRLKKENIKDRTKSGIPVSYYHGPKMSEMPEEVKKHVLPRKVLVQQTILVQRSKFHDF